MTVDLLCRSCGGVVAGQHDRRRCAPRPARARVGAADRAHAGGPLRVARGGAARLVEGRARSTSTSSPGCRRTIPAASAPSWTSTCSRGVNLPAAHIGFLQGDTADEAGECARYERAIDEAGGLDLLVLGFGANGHIGFNEPGPELHASTHAVALHASTRAANADRFEGDPERVPVRALTLGMGQVFRARRVLMLATGAAKAEAVTALLRGPLTTMCPASWLQVHPDATLLVDRAAGARLRNP